MPTNVASSHAPLASLAAHWNACKGVIPPPLVGASITLVDNVDPAKARIYLFGGRLVTTRRMVNDMYELNLLSLQWTKLSGDIEEGEASTANGKASTSSHRQHSLLQARYFHSCNLWDDKLIIFGGMGYVVESETELGVLDEVVAFDLRTKAWDFSFGTSVATSAQASLMPQARYAHLSSTTADALIIIGGQDMANRYVEEINVLDLRSRQWIVRQTYEKQRGSYRSLAVELLSEVEDPSPAATGSETHDIAAGRAEYSHSLLSPMSINMLPMSTRSLDDAGKPTPLPVHVYTNYNFTDVRREMEIVELHGKRADCAAGVVIEDKSHAMSGASLPPGLRFPTGAVLGVHLLISGTYLANTSQTFALWALHLPTMTWSRLDVGPLLSTGSWNRGILWHSQSRMIVLGHRDRELVADYNHRQTNWNHVLMIELEAWGITQPPEKRVSLAGIQMGIEKLASSTIGSFSASLESGVGQTDVQTGDPILCFGGRGDFEIICSDGMRLGCDRVILERRWPWFASKMREYQRRIKSLTKNGSPMKRSSRPGTGEQLAALLEVDERNGHRRSGGGLAALSLSTQVDPRITPRQLHISEPSPVVLALLIFLYTRCICTRLQRHPAIIAALLIVSRVYDMKDLEMWTKHAAHVVMSTDLAAPASTADSGASGSGTTLRNGNMSNLPILERHRLAVAIYEAATMSGSEALQIRALRTVMSIAKYVQRSSVAGAKVIPVSPGPAGTTLDRHNSFSASALSPAVVSPAYASPSMQRNDSLQNSLLSGVADDAALNGRPGVRRSSRASTLGSLGVGIDRSGQNGAVPAFASLSRSSTTSNQSSSTALVAGQSQQRRPSAPLLSQSSSNDGNAIRPSANVLQAAPAPATRKRFSIFGRSAHEQPAKQSHASSLAEIPMEASSRHRKDSTEYQTATPTTRLHRSNTQGSAGAESTATRSASSLNSAHAIGSPNEGGSTTSLPRSGEFGTFSSKADGTSSSTGRKMSTTLSRLKGSRQGSGTATPMEEAIAGATVITAPAKLSASGSEGRLASPSRRPMSAGAEGRSGASPKTRTASSGSKLGAGQLKDKDIAALNGIFA